MYAFYDVSSQLIFVLNLLTVVFITLYHSIVMLFGTLIKKTNWKHNDCVFYNDKVYGIIL